MDYTLKNHEFFKANLNNFMKEHKDEYVIIKDEKVVAFYQHIQDALKHAYKEYGSNGNFNICKVTDFIPREFYRL